MRHLRSAELWLLNASYLFATMYSDTSYGLIRLASLSWSLHNTVAASLNALAAPASVDWRSRNRKSTIFRMYFNHFRRDARQFCGLERSQQITTEDVWRFFTVMGTPSSLGSEISPPTRKLINKYKLGYSTGRQRLHTINVIPFNNYSTIIKQLFYNNYIIIVKFT